MPERLAEITCCWGKQEYFKSLFYTSLFNKKPKKLKSSGSKPNKQKLDLANKER